MGRTFNCSVVVSGKKKKVYPTLPKSREDVHETLDSMTTLNSKDEEFVQS